MELAQAYRFWRDVKRAGARHAVTPEQAFERFAGSELFADLRPNAARAKVVSMQLGLLCAPPTEVQSVLLPTFVLRGEISTELQPRYEFIAYVAAVEIDEAAAKRHRWSLARPSLLAA